MGTHSLSPRLLTEVTRRYADVNGEHAMSGDDERHIREHYVAVVSDTTLELMLAGVLPLPSYVLDDGTPMVPHGHAEPLGWSGGAERVHEWFLAHWPDDPATGEREWVDYLAGRHAGLAQVTPIHIRQKARLIAQLHASAAILARDPHDPVGRGQLGEAIEKLDVLMVARTPYDDRRGGGDDTGRRMTKLRAQYLTPFRPELPLYTERLLLREPRVSDAEAMHSYYRDPEVMAYLLSEPLDLMEVEEMLRRRIGFDGSVLSVVAEQDGEVVGDFMIDVKAPAMSTGELGWVIRPTREGLGLAGEAARALIDVGFSHYRLHRIYAELDTRNLRSAALAERLGLRLELDARADHWSKGEWTDSQRWAILAEDWRK